MLEEECPTVGGVEEPCPVWEVCFFCLFLSSVDCVLFTVIFKFLSVLIVSFYLGWVPRSLDS